MAEAETKTDRDSTTSAYLAHCEHAQVCLDISDTHCRLAELRKKLRDEQETLSTLIDARVSMELDLNKGVAYALPSENATHPHESLIFYVDVPGFKSCETADGTQRTDPHFQYLGTTELRTIPTIVVRSDNGPIPKDSSQRATFWQLVDDAQILRAALRATHDDCEDYEMIPEDTNDWDVEVTVCVLIDRRIAGDLSVYA